jgi:hypothetical protein
VSPAAAQGRPVDFIPEERLQFEDAPNRFVRKTLPAVAHFASLAAWMDNTRVIYSTREIVGRWKAGPDDLAKVVTFNISAQTVEETIYRGNLVCYSQGRLLVAVPRFPISPGFSPQGDVLLGGKFGDPLTPITELNGKDILRFSCELNPIVKWFTPDDEVTDVPLLPGHGFLRLPRGARRHVRPGNEPGFELYDVAGKLVQKYVTYGYPLPTYLHYLPWLNEYFDDKGTQYPSELIAPDGGRRIIEPPPMLVSWSIASNVGSGGAMLTRSGMLWSFATWPSYWRMQGIYLRTPGGTLLRVEDAHVPGQPGVAVSPDGCSLFYLRRPGRADRASQPFLSTVLNLCEGANT